MPNSSVSQMAILHRNRLLAMQAEVEEIAKHWRALEEDLFDEGLCEELENAADGIQKAADYCTQFYEA